MLDCKTRPRTRDPARAPQTRTRTVIGTAANVADVTQAHGLLHGEESEVFGDAGYRGVDKREENRDTEVDWHIAMKRGERKALADTEQGRLAEAMEQVKASIRSKVEHPFHVVKNRLGHRKAPYRGLAKNEAQCSRCSAWPTCGAAG